MGASNDPQELIIKHGVFIRADDPVFNFAYRNNLGDLKPINM